MNYGKELVLIFFGEINSNYPQNNSLNLINGTSWILSRIVCDASITGANTFYTVANKSEEAGYKSEKLSKVGQSPSNSAPKAELYVFSWL